MVEILNNFEHHLLQNDFYLSNKMNQMFVGFFNSFLISKCFVLFFIKADLLVYYQNLSLLLNLLALIIGVKISAVNLLNSGVVIYLY